MELVIDSCCCFCVIGKLGYCGYGIGFFYLLVYMNLFNFRFILCFEDFFFLDLVCILWREDIRKCCR